MQKVKRDKKEKVIKRTPPQPPIFKCPTKKLLWIRPWFWCVFGLRPESRWCLAWRSRSIMGSLWVQLLLLLLQALLVPALNNADVLWVKDWRCLVLDCKDLALSSSIEVGKLRKPLWHNKWSNPMNLKGEPHLSCLGWPEWNCYRATGGPVNPCEQTLAAFWFSDTLNQNDTDCLEVGKKLAGLTCLLILTPLQVAYVLT